MNVEDAVLRHPDVADAAVFGVTFPNNFRFSCSLFLFFIFSGARTNKR